MMVYFNQLKTILQNQNSAGTLIHTFQQMTNSLGMVMTAKTPINVMSMSDNLRALATKLDYDSCIVTLHRKTVQYKVITTYQALIEFVAHEGLSLYYLKSGNYLIQINDYTMVISSVGAVVKCDPGFDDELLKVGYKIEKMNDQQARAVLTLSKVLEVKRDGEEYIISFSSAIPGTVDYPGFTSYTLEIGGAMKAKLNPVLRSKGKVMGEAGWYSHSVHVLALFKFFKEQLECDLSYVEEIERFLDLICTVDAPRLALKLSELKSYRRLCEADMMSFYQDPKRCLELCRRSANVLSVFGVSGTASLPYTEEGTKKYLYYPTFEENSDRLKSGRFSRNSDPRKFLNKQYPIVEDGPAAIMGDATADKWERIIATVRTVLGSGALSSFSDMLYAGVTNNDRMLGGVCDAWVASRSDKKLSNLLLLDRNSPNPSKWNLKYGDHEFSFRSPQNPMGEFISMDLIKYIDDMDVSKGKTHFIFSDANVLSTDEENYNQQNEFAVEGIELGAERLTQWIVSHKQASPNGVAAAKYIFKVASKFKAGVIKLHLFKVLPGFLESVCAKLFEVFNVDSFLWKEGRGHNPEFYFYFFPRTDVKIPYYRCMGWLIPVINLCSAVSELTRHVAFYCPNKVEGHANIGNDGLLSHSSSFPVIFPSSNVRSWDEFEISGNKFSAIKNIRFGTKSLVSGISNDVAGTLDLDSFFVDVPPLPKEPAPVKFEMVVAPEKGLTKIVPISKVSTADLHGALKAVEEDIKTEQEILINADSPYDDAPSVPPEESKVKVSTLEAICKALDCQPADLLEYIPEK